MAKKTITPEDKIKVEFYTIKTFYDGSRSHYVVGRREMSGEEAKSIANIGRIIYKGESHYRNWCYIRIVNETKNWCEDYNISRWGNMSVRKTIY